MLALSIAAAPSTATAETVLVLKAGGETLTNGELVNLTLAEKPEYIFKTKVTVSGTSTATEEEVECENYLEQVKVQHNLATDTWRLVQTHAVEICEGTFLEEGLFQTTISLSPAGATAESTMELFRNEEEVRAEEREQAERGEEINPHNPLRCSFITATSKGKVKASAKKPMLVKIKSKMLLQPAGSDPGCGPKGKWKGGFTATYKGQPVFASFEAPPPPTVTEISPNTGPESGGTEVTITGSNFTGGSRVDFGASEASSVKVNSENSITAVAPPGTGMVAVTVTTGGGTSAESPADQYTY